MNIVSFIPSFRNRLRPEAVRTTLSMEAVSPLSQLTLKALLKESLWRTFPG